MQRLFEVRRCVLRADTVMPGAMEIDAFLDRRAEEAPAQLAIPERRVPVGPWLVLEPELQAEAGSERPDPHRQASSGERLAQRGVEQALQLRQVRVEVRPLDLLEEQCPRGEDRHKVGVKGAAVHSPAQWRHANKPWVDDTLTMRPQPRSIIGGANSWIRRKGVSMLSAWRSSSRVRLAWMTAAPTAYARDASTVDSIGARQRPRTTT